VFGGLVKARTLATHVSVPVLLAAGAAWTVSAAASDAPAKAAKSVVLGKTANYPASGCPQENRCEVVARVTGIQMRADGALHPFRAPAKGQIVAWWLKLPELRSSQISSFSELFGGGPAARVAILRRGKKGRVRLVRQSPTENLRPHLGKPGRARFRLAQPLHVEPGDYVGLTSVTWMPGFAVSLDAVNDVWLASRPQSRCDTPSSTDPERFARYYRRSDAHEQESTVKRYRCTYRTARLLYWARFVPDQQPEPGGGQTP
jgi:hypothetical protein